MDGKYPDNGGGGGIEGSCMFKKNEWRCQPASQLFLRENGMGEMEDSFKIEKQFPKQ